MPLLSICIPNYNRVRLLERLLVLCVQDICKYDLYDEVELCICDDCSKDNPRDVINNLKSKFHQVSICFKQHTVNMGMDWNFLDCVLMAHGEYAWIIGNDDHPSTDGIKNAIQIIKQKKDADFIVFPFDCYTEVGQFIKTHYPLKNGTVEQQFDTYNDKDIDRLLAQTIHNCSLFDFLSNVIFKRSRWIEHGDMFKDKMNSIFIQVYMNLQTLVEGAKYYYVPQTMIVQYGDSVTNESIDRKFRIFKGLYEVSLHFFEGERQKIVQHKWVDSFCARELFDDSLCDEIKMNMNKISTPMSECTKKYYISAQSREKVLAGKQIYIYGAGRRGCKIHRELENINLEVESFVDQSCEKQVNGVMGCKVISLEEFMQLKTKADYIIISIADVDVVYELIDYFREYGMEDRILLL